MLNQEILCRMDLEEFFNLNIHNKNHRTEILTLYETDTTNDI